MVDSPPPPSTTQKQCRTVADCLFWLPNEWQRRQLESYRISYEKANGPTDLTRYYTSQWPAAMQDLLFELDTEAYFNGLPPFVQAYIISTMKEQARTGELDNAPDKYLKVFIKKQMAPPSDGRQR